MMRRVMVLSATALASALALAVPVSTSAAGYWDTDIPTMQGAENVVKKKDREKASISASFDVVIEDHKAPLKMYDAFFQSKGWTHHMDEVYAQFPTQFKRPPNEDWSSFAARSENGSYELVFGTMWENKTNGSTATLQMTLSGTTGNAMNAHVDATIAPRVDGSAFLKLIQLTRDDPQALLRLAAIAGGDPFDVEKVNIGAVRSITAKDKLTTLYLEAIDSVMAQIAQFAGKNLPPQ